MAIAIAEQIERQANECIANNIPILSFFTGAGFLDLGFIQAGFDIIWSNEFHPGFVRGYEYAMEGFALGGTGHRITNSNSIVTLGPNQIAREAFRNTPIPATFGIIGGPPCPDFSVAFIENVHTVFVSLYNKQTQVLTFEYIFGSIYSSNKN